MREISTIESLQNIPRSLVADIAGIQRARRFEEHDLDFLPGGGLVFDTPRNNEKFAGRQRHDAIPQSHLQHAAMDQKEFVFVLMVMPDELAFELHAFDVLSVELADDVRIAIARNLRERLFEADEFHGNGWFRRRAPRAP